MIELVNTSLPKGLFAGERGFATAAITQGTGEIARRNLEVFTSYRHRVSTRTEEYWTGNPANFFHAILRDGTDAIGRVAACDFDYTGRSNRIAKIRAFQRGELPPDANPARIALAAQSWLEEPWSGEARFLAPAPAQVREIAGAIETPFGAATLQRLALQLEKCLDTGEAIYFKFTAAADPSCAKLLNLFAAIIDFLPAKRRREVAFSTYAASLPGRTLCHLCGVCDEDAAFKRAAATRAWVDVDRAHVENENLLPVPKSPPPQRAAQPRPQITSSRPQVARPQYTLPAAPNSSDAWLWWTIGGSLVVVLVFAIVAWRFIASDNTTKITAAGTTGQVQKIRDIENEKEKEEEQAREREKRAQEEAARAAALIAAEREKNEKKEAAMRAAEESQKKQEAEERKRKEAEKAGRQKQQAEASALKAQQAEEAALTRIKAFTNATSAVSGRLPKPDGNKIEDEPKGDAVFFYVDNKIVREDIVWTAQIGLESNEVTGWIPSIDYGDQRLEKSPVVVWLRGSTAWFDWREAKKEITFGEHANIDLRKRFFGPDDAVARVWVNHNGERYRIGHQNETPFVRKNNILAPEDVLKLENDELAQQLYALECEISSTANEIKELKSEIAELEKRRAELERQQEQIKPGSNNVEANRMKDELSKTKEKIKIKKDELDQRGNAKIKHENKLKEVQAKLESSERMNAVRREKFTVEILWEGERQ